MTRKSEDATAESSLLDDFATTMPAWMPDGIDDVVEAAADAAQEAVAEPSKIEAETASQENGDTALADANASDATADLAPDDDAAADGAAIVVLPRQARLPQAEDIIEQLLAAIDADDFVIDAREVEDITAPVVTALISAMNSRADRTPPVAVLAPTPAFVDAFSDLGLFQDLMKMEFRQ
jgi:hypothetical protein